MKITGTNSYIKVELDGKIYKIDGEMIVGGFVAYKDTMVLIEKDEEIAVDEESKLEIIQKVSIEAKDPARKIIFE